MTHHWSENKFATCGQQVDIWDEQRSEPIRSFTWGVDSIGSVKFNPVEVIITMAFLKCRNASAVVAGFCRHFFRNILRINLHMVFSISMAAYWTQLRLVKSTSIYCCLTCFSVQTYFSMQCYKLIACFCHTGHRLMAR